MKFSKRIWCICHTHQTTFEFLWIFCPLHFIRLILQRKEILCLVQTPHFALTSGPAGKESQSDLRKPTVKSFSQHICTMPADL